MLPPSERPWLIIDAESIGLYGTAFAVAGGVFIKGKLEVGTDFVFACPPDHCAGADDDRKWVEDNISPIKPTHDYAEGVRQTFWLTFQEMRSHYPDLILAGECIYPVEVGFIRTVIKNGTSDRKWEGPYPFHDIASIMLAAGMDPMATYERQPDELPAHDPMADVRLSARLLAKAFRILDKRKEDAWKYDELQ